MKKIKSFLNTMEERYFFPIGRRTWQILSLIAFLLLSGCIVYFLTNSTPTSRESIKVTKEEVVEQKIDTQAVVETPVASCQLSELQSSYDSLKAYTSKLEWKNLGDSSGLETIIVTDENGNYIYNDFGYPLTTEAKKFIENDTAIPNIVENIFKNRGIDSSDICERINIIKTLVQFCKITSPKFTNSNVFIYYSRICAESSSINANQVQSSFSFKTKLEGKQTLISNEDDIRVFSGYLNYIIENSIDESKLNTAIELITKHRELNSKNKYDNNEYFEIAKLILEIELSSEELVDAIHSFTVDIEYYDNNNLYKSLKTYLKLYKEKIEIAESEKLMRESEKVANRSISITYGMYAFFSIVGIATILLLFSIQNILKQNQDKQ
jgi:hypothetical protein